jgi:cell wall-associated NlpC family hydrolase
MEGKITRRNAIAVLSLAGISQLSLLLHPAYGQETQSHYELHFTYSLESLTGDLDRTERGDSRRESEVPHHEWYSHYVRHKFGSWGPKARTYTSLERLEEKPIDWKRERVLAVAQRFLGYGYQHHHIPDWDPPASWPWKQSCVGHNGKGFDCSNFTSFVYNQGFGIKMTSAVERQAELRSAVEEGGSRISLRRIELPDDYERRQQVLRTGDLVYIRGREDGPITHVVIWVGSVGRAPSGVPLIMDSHGGGVVDDDERPIPCGVQLRPFRAGSWYDRCASHAHRIFHDSIR